ncbi:MAG: CarD family transcriptional regulator [Desulfobulbaceae bacterium]|nr:MAG: CarD family transcriptional regulator [Desulfobulbaceae bacterium]
MAVYPAHGVGEIQAIETKNMAGLEQSFYVIKIIDSAMVVMIPCNSSEKVGLRAIASPADADKVFDILKQTDVEIVQQPWNQRYREYMEKIKTGSIFEIAAVLRDLFLLQHDKELSFGERKMVDTAKSLLVTEIALAHQADEDEVAKQIDEIFVVA